MSDIPDSHSDSEAFESNFEDDFDAGLPGGRRSAERRRKLDAGRARLEVGGDSAAYLERYASEDVSVELGPDDVEILDEVFEPGEDEFSEISQRIIRNVKRGADAGLDLLVDMITPGSEHFGDVPAGVKMRVAQDLLDREGSAPRVQRSEVKSTSVHLTGSELAQITGRGRAKRITDG